MNISAILIASFCSSVCVVLSFLACTIKTDNSIEANWWPMFVFATYIFFPFPVLIIKGLSDTGTMKYWAFFTSGWILTASFGIPSILAHTGVIAPGNCGFSVGASVVFYGSILLSEFIYRKE